MLLVRHSRGPEPAPRQAGQPQSLGLRLKICQGFDQYANVRPPSPLDRRWRCRPEDLNWVIVRENSEGEYAGVGGRAHQGHAIEVATDVTIMTRVGVERILRFAFKLAQSRPRKLLTVVTKSNAQRHASIATPRATRWRTAWPGATMRCCPIWRPDHEPIAVDRSDGHHPRADHATGARPALPGQEPAVLAGLPAGW